MLSVLLLTIVFSAVVYLMVRTGMEPCSHYHEPILFKGVNCPMCTANDEIDTLEENIEQLEIERARPFKQD